ncbi:hypothetical protein HMPREF1137_0370 [Actinomyces sp. ICM39]|nr:hypothetical protein HMPREF1137_0370 [Actinomyces sp. ICM39]
MEEDIGPVVSCNEAETAISVEEPHFTGGHGPLLLSIV